MIELKIEKVWSDYYGVSVYPENGRLISNGYTLKRIRAYTKPINKLLFSNDFMDIRMEEDEAWDWALYPNGNGLI